MVAITNPTFQKEGPATACKYHGELLGWKNCTCLSFGMGIDQSSRGAIKLSGCTIRMEIRPEDYLNGTTIEQNAKVAEAHGIHVEIHTGRQVAAPSYLAIQMYGPHRGVSLAGNCSAIGKGNVNHNIFLHAVHGGKIGAPTSVDVYDPWSDGPAVWSWTKAMAFAHALHPWGEEDPRTLKSLGINGVYSALFAPEQFWGSDVPKALQAVNPYGHKIADACKKAGVHIGAVVNVVDLAAFFRKVKKPVHIIDAAAVQWIVTWNSNH